MRAYIALRGRKPTDPMVNQITSRFEGITLDNTYSGPHTLLRVNEANPNVVGSIVNDFRGTVWPFADGGAQAREYLNLLTRREQDSKESSAAKTGQSSSS